MFLPRLLFFSLFLLTFLASNAQSRFRVSIVNKNQEAVPFATVSISSLADTTRKTTRVADSSGRVTLQLREGRYRLNVKAVNYKELVREISITSSQPDVTLELQPSASDLATVTVTARKPLMRQEDDKTIVDPEPIVLGSTNAYEVMERIPGLFSDQDGNFYLNSTSPSAIWINGREQRMSAADVATLLKSLPPNSIQSIEIIRSPSARYDASGGDGIVNVILKKNVKLGMTGSVNAGLSQGRYGNQFAGFNINNNDGKLTTYVNANVTARNSFEELQTDRFIGKDSRLSQFSYTKYPGGSAYLGFGMAYQFNPKWELAADTRISHNLNRSNNSNTSVISQLPSENITSSNTAEVTNDGQNNNFSQGFNLKYKIDSLGSEWTTDLNYNYARYTNDQLLVNSNVFPSASKTLAVGDFGNHSHFFTVQTNLVKKLKSKMTIETGLKTSNVWFNNSTRYFFVNGGTQIPDNVRTNAYLYDEHIHAAYAQASKPLGGFILKGGLRVENTNMNGRQTIPTDTSFSIRRTDAFPYVYLSRNLMKIMGYELRGFLIYRRTISRPSYSLLNPAIRIIDPFLFETGNPSLRPQFTNNYEVNISVDERPVFAVGYNDTRDIFSQVVYQADSNQNIAYRTYDNLGTNKETYFRMVGAVPGKIVFIVAGLQYNHNFYNGQYEGDPLSFRRGTITVFTYQNFRLRPTTNLSINGFYRWKGQQQFYELGNFGNLNINLSQQLLEKKLTLTVGVTDLFYTNWNTFTIQQGSLRAEGYRKNDTRRFTLNLRYNFGIRKKEEKKGMMEVPEEG
jgi:hypothetical protein